MPVPSYPDTWTAAMRQMSSTEGQVADRLLCAASGTPRKLDQNDVLYALTVPTYRETVFPACDFCGSPELHDLDALDICPAYEAWRMR